MRDGFRGRKSPITMILAALLLLAAAAGVYFFIDSMTVSRQISSIDSIKYDVIQVEKTERYEAKGKPLAAAPIKEDLGDKTYKTPLGFSIISHSDKWKGQKLVDIYNELIKNEHGDEIYYVSEVDVYPNDSDIDTTDFQVAGTQDSKEEYYPVFFGMPSFIPESLKYTMSRTSSVISLYNMDRYDSAAQAAETIAHEYGHHYTIYYFLKDDTTAVNSEYYKIRGFGGFGHQALYGAGTYYQNHQWDIYEIAAEDYVELMGSPDVKQPMEFKDVEELINSGAKSYDIRFYGTTVNVFPQENINIPLSDEVPGLRDYYYSFVGKKNDYEPLKPVDFNLQISKHSKYGHTYYKITWDKTSTDKDALYTLVCYDSEGDLFRPVKTVHGDEEPYAIVGTYSRLRGFTITYWPDNIPKEGRIFKLYLILPDGRMQASKIFKVDF